MEPDPNFHSRSDQRGARGVYQLTQPGVSQSREKAVNAGAGAEPLSGEGRVYHLGGISVSTG